ncbi:MAG: rubrerythrin family protein [Smithellaceae bacterium]|jgi:rubrerythrin|nr:rubrerythrin family protein [Smithellaceae bacterium]MDD3258979.1 rubrerythrin family protein [Smithellaceae bacterium]MDD3848975.1 rubrerythrin family protein [Smithellaceae bacterium]
MDEKIREALREAYVGEAKAALRLSMFADKAEQEGYPQIARLFRVIAFSEEIHGKRALRVLKEIKTTEENLAESFESEKTVAEIAYDRFVKMAEQAGDKQALLHFSQSRDVEETHAKLYKQAMNHFMEERQTVYHVCKVCGYVADGVLPEECPVCAAKKDQFTTFDR